MDLKIDINPEDINKMVSEAILKSAIGPALTKVIEEEVSKLSRSYDNPIAPVVRQIIHQTIRDLILNEFKEPIEKHVRENLTAEIQTQLASKAWDALLNK